MVTRNKNILHFLKLNCVPISFLLQRSFAILFKHKSSNNYLTLINQQHISKQLLHLLSKIQSMIIEIVKSNLKIFSIFFDINDSEDMIDIEITKLLHKNKETTE